MEEIAALEPVNVPYNRGLHTSENSQLPTAGPETPSRYRGKLHCTRVPAPKARGDPCLTLFQVGFQGTL